MKILIAGELNPDLILRDYRVFPAPGKEVLVNDLELTLGSSSAICAVGLARLGNSVTFAANVGDDVNGNYCVEFLRRENIDVSHVNRRPDLKTGITVSITSSRDRALVTYLGAIPTLTAADVPTGIFADHAHLHVSGYYLQSGLRGGLRELFASARKGGMTTSLDTGWDPTEEWASDLIDTLNEVDVFLPNESEIRSITGCADVAQGLDLLDNGHTLVVGKLGSEGCLTRYQGALIRQRAFDIDVVDTTGAGDSFVAGFLHSWLRRQPIAECMRFANACGALSTRGLGGTTTQPVLEEVENFLLEHGREFRAQRGPV